MAGPRISQYLARQDYETFLALVRKFNHDVANKLSPLTTECGIILKVIERVPAEQLLDIPESAAQAQAGHVAREAQAVVDALSKVGGFFFPPGATDTEAINRARWAPYSALAWDALFAEFGDYVRAQLQLAVPLVNRLTTLKYAEMIRPDGKGQTLLDICDTIPQRQAAVESILTPEGCEGLLKEWLDKQLPP